MKIVVYAIAKNEINFVDRWYESMKEADEIVVMDTGSTDGTDARLSELGCRVIRHTVVPWRFDKARNISLGFVSEDADLVVCTDLDEYFSAPGWRKLIEDACEIEREKTGSYPNQIRYTYIHSFESDDVTPAVIYTYNKIHSRNGFSWRQMLHEVIKPDTGTKICPVYVTGLVLEHHTVKKDLRKSTQEDLCRRWVEEEPWNAAAHSYMAHYLYANGHLNEALNECDIALFRYEAILNYSVMAYSDVLRNRATICKTMGDPVRQELSLLRAVNVAPDDRRAALDLAELYLSQRRWLEVGMTGYRGAMMKMPANGMFSDPTPVDATNYKLPYLSFIGFANAGRVEDAEAMAGLLRDRYSGITEVKSALDKWDSSSDKKSFFADCRVNHAQTNDNSHA